jgi:hypothetical protein
MQQRLTERQQHHLELLQAHERNEKLLVKIAELFLSEQNRLKNLAKRKPFDEMVGISAVTPIVLDYRERKHIFIYSVNALVLSLEDMGTMSLAANTWTDISFRPGLYVYAPAQSTTTAYVSVKQTDDPPATNPQIKSVTPALTAFASNAAATGSGTDVTFKWGTAGNTPANHVSIQNNGTINVLYSFDVATTTSGAMVYTLAPGQLAIWDRSVTVLHFQTASAVNFGGTTGITVEGFA